MACSALLVTGALELNRPARFGHMTQAASQRAELLPVSLMNVCSRAPREEEKYESDWPSQYFHPIPTRSAREFLMLG